MEENSPLRFLDYDVSQMIYEKYYPSIRSKQWKNMVNDQFKYHLRNYLEDYKLNNIYEKKIKLLRRIPFSRNNIQPSFTQYLVYHYKYGKKKVKYANTRGPPGSHMREMWHLPSHNMARKYRREAHKLKL